MSSERTTPPLPGYDDLSVEALENRVRSLTAEQMRELIAYEETHGDRMDVLELLKDRLNQLEGGADPSSGSQAGEGP